MKGEKRGRNSLENETISEEFKVGQRSNDENKVML